MDEKRSITNSSRTQSTRTKRFDCKTSEVDLKIVTRDLKNSLIIKRNPDKSTINKIPNRLRKAHRKLIILKDNYKPDFNIVKATLARKDLFNIPDWFDNIITSLQFYLDVVIINKKIIKGSQVLRSYHIIGEENQAIIASYYIDYLYTTITRIVESEAINHKRAAKQLRRKLRDGRLSGTLTMGDTRTFSSELRGKLLKDISIFIERLLEELRLYNKDTVIISLDRQKQIVNKLSSKYGKTWRAKLSN